VRLGKRKPGVLGYLRRIGPGWYRVRRGDSLWRIADRCYGDGRHYPVILASNARTIRNPDLIYPRQRLYVP
jgi:nucleoid-associated protein YgaU